MYCECVRKYIEFANNYSGMSKSAQKAFNAGVSKMRGDLPSSYDVGVQVCGYDISDCKWLRDAWMAAGVEESEVHLKVEGAVVSEIHRELYNSDVSYHSVCNDAIVVQKAVDEERCRFCLDE